MADTSCISDVSAFYYNISQCPPQPRWGLLHGNQFSAETFEPFPSEQWALNIFTQN
jgi:hypothetical protein